MSKLGILSTYNQTWGISRYVRRLAQSFSAGNVLVLAEEVAQDTLLAADEPFVRRCWNRREQDFSKLAQVLQSEGVELLHLNCSYPYLDSPAFHEFLRSQKARGITLAAHVHDFEAANSVLRETLELSDLVFVDRIEQRQRLVAKGISAERIHLLPAAATVVTGDLAEQARHARGIAADQQNIVCLDFGVAEARIEDIISAVYYLQGESKKAHLHVLQLDCGPNIDGGYGDSLREKVQQLHLDNYVHFVREADTERCLDEYLSLADVVVFSSDKPIFEAREALGMALERGAAIINAAPSLFDTLQFSLFSITDGYPLATAISEFLESKQLRAELSNAARQWAQIHDAKAIAGILAEIYAASAGVSLQVASEITIAQPSAPAAVEVTHSPLRVLMQNRSNAFTHRGGDTVVMERVAEGLRSRGHLVDMDVESNKQPRDYDIVHLFNFAMREETERLARNAHEQGTPYVVTTMYEDWPIFYNQKISLFYALNAYVDVGQPLDKWQELLVAARDTNPSERWDNGWTADHAAALIATGQYEAESLRRDYPNTRNVEIYHCGNEVADMRDGGELFRKETGIDDFVLCVGRLETRKNQLMLLKAMEESELTLVFAAGGFSYQAEYDAACRKFKRKGKTIFLDRLEPEVLASAFQAARVHVLPSWFELPGLVSLEAAAFGTNVVVTEFGTARDYFGSYAYYCNPGDDQSILNAVLAAYYSPTKQGLQEQVAQFTWDKAAERNLEIYLKALGRDAGVSTSAPSVERAPSFVAQTIDGARSHAEGASETVVQIPEVVGCEQANDSATQQALAHCAAGDAFMIKEEQQNAKAEYEQALALAPKLPRSHRSLGVVAMNAGELDTSEGYFVEALKLDPRDTKSLVGLGALELQRGKKEEAFDLYVRASENDPDSAATLLHMVNLGYDLGRLNELEAALRKFLKNNRDNVSVQYCLAGCYFRQEKYGAALGVLEHIIQVNPNYEKAVELKEEIEKRKAGETLNIASEQLATTTNSGQVASTLQGLEEAKKRREYDTVLEGAEKLLKANEGNDDQRALARILRAESLACSGDAASADVEFAKVLTNDAYGYRAYAGRGAIAASLAQWNEANALFEHSLSLRPNYDIAIAGLGICAFNDNKPEEAWDHFTTALKINCENTQALHGLVQLGYSQNRIADAEQALLNYLDVHPVDLSILYTLAGCLYSQGRFPEAKEQCQKILLFENEHELAKELVERIDAQQAGNVPPQ